MFAIRPQLLCVLLLPGALVGCDQAGDKESKDSNATANVRQVSLPESLNGKLAEADALDGAADKHIHKCYSCALGMDGSEDYTAEVNGYQVCFCSEACLEHFEKEAESVVTSTKIPGSEKEPDEVESGQASEEKGQQGAADGDASDSDN